MISVDPLVWISSILIVIAISFGFRSSRPWRVVEQLFIGGAAGNAIKQQWGNIERLGIKPILNGDYAMLLAFILGIVLYLQFTKEYKWVARYPIAILVGSGIGISMATLMKSMFVDQITATITNLNVPGSPMNSVNNIIILLFVVSTLLFFIFTKETGTGPLGYFSRIGRIGLLAAFGAGYAGTSMTYIAVLIDSLRYLLFTWLGL